MADNIAITPGTGALAATDEITQREGAAISTGEQEQRVKLSQGKNGIAYDIDAEPWGALNVNIGAQTLIYDEWAGSTLDTQDRWTVTGTAPAIAGGLMTMPATVSTYNAIQSKELVRPNAGYALVRNGFALEAGTVTGAGRFWGQGFVATTPAPGVLVQDGIGFEIDQATGALLAVTYKAGVRTTIATLTKPADGLNHGYGCYLRATGAFWLIDGVEVARKSFPDLALASFPSLIVRQNAASFGGGTPAFVNLAHLTADTSRSGVVIADPLHGTRQARVTTGNGLQVAVTGHYPAYRLFVPIAAVGANKVFFDLFNATGSGKTIRVLSVVPIVSGAVAVTGVLGVDLYLTRTSTVGTGATPASNDSTLLTTPSLSKMNPNDPALPSQITARAALGGTIGAAGGGAVLSAESLFTEETNSSTYVSTLFDFVRRMAGPAAPPLIVPEGTGIRVIQGAVASVGNIGFDVLFEVI